MIDLLAHKYENPFAAAVAGYVLLTTSRERGRQYWHDWSRISPTTSSGFLTAQSFVDGKRCARDLAVTRSAGLQRVFAAGFRVSGHLQGHLVQRLSALS